MKMKRLLVNLSMLAIAHMIMMATGSAAYEELQKNPISRARFVLSASLFLLSFAILISLYAVAYIKTSKK